MFYHLPRLLRLAIGASEDSEDATTTHGGLELVPSAILGPIAMEQSPAEAIAHVGIRNARIWELFVFQLVVWFLLAVA